MKKYKVNIDRTKPDSEEILARRNFDELMKQYNAAPGKIVHKPFWKSMWFAGAVATAAAVAVTVIIFTQQPAVKPGESPVVKGPGTRHADTSSTPAPLAQQEKRRVAPPLKNLDVAFSNYKLNAGRGGTITHPSGSKLVFPANAFVDDAGNVVSGNVEIRYRELRDPVDVFLAGIPLQYDSAGKTYQFESAGMMQVAAFVNGKVVFLDKNKPVEVQFVSKQQEPGFNVYEFDTALGNWVYRGGDRVQPKEEPAGVPALTAAQQQEKRAQADAQLAHEMADAQKNNPLPEEPVKPRRADTKKNRFSLNIDPKEFPEMAVYKNVIFEVDETREKFDTNAFYHVTWESIVLSKGAAEGRYLVTLKKGLTVMKADVYPVFTGRNYEEAMKVYDRKFTDYQAALGRRTDAEKAARSRYENALSAMVPSEAAQANAAVSEQVMRVFSIHHFGIYNCDTPENFPQGSNCVLTLEDESGAPVDAISSLFHVDRSRFGLFSYYFNGAISGFSFNPSSSNLMWGVRDGKLYVADDEQFASLKGQSRGKLVMKEVKQQFRSAEEMKVFFRITTGA